MSNQWIRADADNLIKEIQGEKVVSKSHTDCPEESQCKTGIKSGLGMFVQTAHVAHGIEHCNNPQERSCQSKNHGKGINPERNAYAGKNIKNSALQHLSCQNIRHH